MGNDANVTATQPVEAVRTRLATQSVLAPGARTATQPIEAPGAGSEVYSQITDSLSSSLDDNPFAGARAQPSGMVSIKLPADERLCRKLEKLNLTMADGYPSRTSETAGLLRDQFIMTPRFHGASM